MLALTLSRHDFREYDQRIGFYTKEIGKIETIARGVKKIVSKNASALEPFALLEIELAPGRELTYITRAQTISFFKNVRDNFEKNLLGCYCLNLVNDAVQPGEKDDKIFDLLLNFLEDLDSVAEVNTKTAYDFILRFLGVLGFAPKVDKAAGPWVIPYAEYHLNRKVVDIVNFREKLYSFS